jgi:hypothetical protein
VSGDGTYQSLDPADVSVTNLDDDAEVEISGVVTYLGSPLEGVTIDLTGLATATATTDAGGAYAFEGLTPGAYTVTPTADGYEFTPASAVFGNVTSDEVADFTAGRVYTLSGSVRDLNEGGLAGVTVTLTGSESDTTTTDGDGLYSFVVPAGGTYTLSPDLDGFVFAEPSMTTEPLQEDLTVDFVATSGIFRRYFAEGAANTFFDTQLALLNATSVPANVTLRFERDDGVVVTHTRVIPARTRETVDPKRIAGLNGAAFSTVVESDVPVAADRTMVWDTTKYGGHAETSIVAPQTTWYLAEGATIAGFNLFYLVHNPNAEAAQIEVRYLRPAPLPALVKPYTVPANTRLTIWVNQEDPELASAEISAVITSTNAVPVIVERAMYLDTQGQLFGAGHEGAGIPAPATEWFLAEGATGPYFDNFVLIANPSVTDAEVEAVFLLPDGTTVTKTYTVAAGSRFNIWVDLADPLLADTAVSTKVTSTNDVPIVVERSMWWPGTTWHEGHNAVGATRAGAKWMLAEGESNRARNLETYVLLANTSPFAGSVRVTVVFEDGTQEVQTYDLLANSRFTAPIGGFFPEAVGSRFGVIVESLGETPAQIVVERAMYWDAVNRRGVRIRWAGGTDALGTRIR